jgi:hypothetical protein
MGKTYRHYSEDHSEDMNRVVKREQKTQTI